MSLEQKTEAAPKAQLAPELKKRLRNKLGLHAALLRQRAAMDLAIERNKNEIEALRAESGESSIKLDGYTVSVVNSTYEWLNKEKLVLLGCAANWITEATERKPKKPFTMIRVPGDKDGK